MDTSKGLGFNYFKFNFEQMQLRSGCLLIAQPGLSDPFFRQTVIFLIDHGGDGSVGFIINRQLQLGVGSVIEGFPADFDVSVALGGPVSPDTLTFLHTLGEAIPDASPLGNGLYLNGDIGAMRGLAIAGKLNRQNFRVFAGYAGWGAHQLGRELEEDSWVVASPDAAHLMMGLYDSWYVAVQQLGKKFKSWTIYPENPSLN